MRTKVLLTVSVWICCYSILSAQTTDIRSSGESLKSESKSPLTYTTVVDLGVAELSVGKDNIHHVFLRYGDKATRLTDQAHGQTICYYSPEQNTYLIIAFHESTIETITLSSRQDAKKELCRKSPIKDVNLSTGKGVRLGDSPESVVRVYGQPGKSYTKDKLLVYEYHSDREHSSEVKLYYDANLYFRNGKLVELVIHDGE